MLSYYNGILHGINKAAALMDTPFLILNYLVIFNFRHNNVLSSILQFAFQELRATLDAAGVKEHFTNKTSKIGLRRVSCSTCWLAKFLCGVKHLHTNIGIQA